MRIRSIRLNDGTELRPRFTVVDSDRHGNVRVYYRRHGRKVRLHNLTDTASFLAEYQAAAAAPKKDDAPATGAPAASESLRWLIQQYYVSGAYRDGLSARTRYVRRGLLDAISEKHGHKPFRLMESRHVEQIMEEKAGFPEAANNRLKALRRLFAWAKRPMRLQRDPTADVPFRECSNPDGFYTWSMEDVRLYEARHAIGTKARLALALLLCTGVRRSDVVRLGRQMERVSFAVVKGERVRVETLHFTEFKGRKRMPKHRAVPILPELRAVIDASPSGNLTYLVTGFGKPFTANGFGNWLKRRCREAGLEHCSAHGLRKAGATNAAENGATEHQLMAMFGWENPRQAAVYTRKANRDRLAAGAMHLVMPERTEKELVPPAATVVAGGTKQRRKS